MALKKNTVVGYTPPTAGTPGFAGSPAVPAHFRPVSLETLYPFGVPKWTLIKGGVIVASTSQTTKPVPATGPLGTWFPAAPVDSSALLVFVPATPALPPIAPVPGTTGGFFTDRRPGWNAGAISAVSLNGNVSLYLEARQSAVGIFVGLNQTNTGVGYQEIDYAIYFKNGTAAVYENGVKKTDPVVFVAGAYFNIERIAGVVSFFKDGDSFYTSATPSEGVLFADTSMYSGGDEISFTSFDQVEPYTSAFSTMLPLASVSSTSPYSYADSRMLPMDSISASDPPYTEANSDMEPMESASSDGGYTSAKSDMLPMEARGEVELVPDSAEASSAMLPMQTLAMVLRGSLIQASSVMRPMRSVSSDVEYTYADSAMEPMETFALSLADGEVAPIVVTAILESPAGEMYGEASDRTGENSFVYSLDAYDMSAAAGARAVLVSPAGVMEASGTIENLMRAVLVSPAGIMEGSGTIGLLARAELEYDQFDMIGYAGAVCSIDCGAGVMEASGTIGLLVSAVFEYPLYEMVGIASIEGLAHAVLESPAGEMDGGSWAEWEYPYYEMVAIGTAVVATPTYEGYAVNLNHASTEGQTDEVTRYTNYPFTHIRRYKNSYFGAGPGGLYLLQGTTDDGQAIDYAVKTCVTDFKKSEKKTVASAYFGGRLGPAATLTLFAGEAGQEAYGYSTPRGQIAQNHREKFGRGVKDRYFAIGVNGSDVMELDALELEVNVMTRRI